jgi:hypothetical protein
MKPQTLSIEAWRLEMEPGGVSGDQICITLMRRRIRIRIKVKSWIRTRIRIKVTQIRNPASPLTTTFQIFEHYCAGARC